MEVQIEPYNAHQLDAVIGLSLRAWAPVFESIQKVLDTDVYRAFYPDNWRVSQQKAVEDVCAAEDTNVWVAIAALVGCVADKQMHHSVGHPANPACFYPSMTATVRAYSTALY